MRVYYQDTDAGGVVFHATYLDFFERARMEWMRALGCDASALAGRHGLVFIVRRIEVAYLKPAVLDDWLTVGADVQKLGRAQLTFAQQVRRGGELLVQASVNVACVAAGSLKPAPFPEPVRTLLAAGAGSAAHPATQGPSTQPRGAPGRV